MLVKSEAFDAFEKYWAADGKSALSSKDTKTILKFILPHIGSQQKDIIYNKGPKAMSRLEQFATDSGNKSTREREMERFMKDDKEMQQGGL